MASLVEGIRARANTLAVHGQTPFAELGLSILRYDTRTSLDAVTSRGVGLCFVLQGIKALQLESLRVRTVPGEMLVVTRGTDLRAVVEATDRPYLALSVWFDPERVARTLLRLAESEVADDDVPPAFTMVPSESIVSTVERLLDAAADAIDRTTIAPLILDELMFRLLRSDAAGAVRAGIGPPREVARILDVMQFIRDNHTRKLTVSVLAKRVAMSPSYFAHQFSRIAHLSPMKYVREVRLDRARTLLGEKGTRPTDVAKQVGFESAAHFTREFKRRYGAPPSRYQSNPRATPSVSSSSS
jgi:AraC-like DNA-binding protein